MRRDGFKSWLRVLPGGDTYAKDFAQLLLIWARTRAKPGKYIVHVYENITKEQRGYFHAIIVPHFRDIQDDMGIVLTIEQAKIILRKKFIATKTMDVANGDGVIHSIEYLPSSESLTKMEYSRFIQDCLNWFIDQFNAPAPEAEVDKEKRK